MRVAIVEDEAGEASRLLSYLEKYQGEKISVPMEAEVFQSGLQFLSDFQNNFDLVFLDIQMPRISGMEIARQIRKLDGNVMIVFVTNLQQYAIEGYSVQAMDFAIKPVKYSRIAAILDRAAAHLRVAEKRIFIGVGDNYAGVLLSDIYYVEVFQHTLIYHTKEGNLKVYGTLKKVEAELKEHGFVCCSKSYLVNLAHVKSINGNEVTVGPDKLSIAIRRKAELLQSIAAYKVW